MRIVFWATAAPWHPRGCFRRDLRVYRSFGARPNALVPCATRARTVGGRLILAARPDSVRARFGGIAHGWRGASGKASSVAGGWRAAARDRAGPEQRELFAVRAAQVLRRRCVLQTPRRKSPLLSIARVRKSALSTRLRAAHRQRWQKDMHAIRQGTTEDVEDFFELRCSVAENWMTRAELADDGITPDRVRAMLDSGDYLAPVVEQAGRMVGFGMAEISRGYVFAVFVRKGCEGRGIGRRILEHLQTELCRRESRTLSLHCGGAASVRAHGFFRHLGWKEDGTTVEAMLGYTYERRLNAER